MKKEIHKEIQKESPKKAAKRLLKMVPIPTRFITENIDIFSDYLCKVLMLYSNHRSSPILYTG